MSDLRPTIAIGPRYSGIGSWEWVGQDMANELEKHFRIEIFSDRIPDCDLAIIVKYDFSQIMQSTDPMIPVIYCPIDGYGSSSDIDRDGPLLFRCQRIILHSESLRKYFLPYASVEFIDHHVKFYSSQSSGVNKEGPILWTGLRSNLPPLIEWLNLNPLPRDLWILTNLDGGQESVAPSSLGITSANNIRIEAWSPTKHFEWATQSGAAIDIKGDDFRSRHKPPTKAFDSLASFLPLAMNQDSNSVKHLAKLGFDVATPEDSDYWFSDEYREEAQRFGITIRELNSQERVGMRFKQIIDEVIDESNTRSIQVLLPKNLQVNQIQDQRTEIAVDNLDLQVNQNPTDAVKKVAVVSFLYNWPSTGGGNIHTTELVRFLGEAGYEVLHFYPRFDPWNIGQVNDTSPIESECLEFSSDEWRADLIRQRFQKAVVQFDPDCVIITDSWNFKPHLADALKEYPCFLRMQAHELLCPLNNLRLLPSREFGLSLCPHNQLQHPSVCFDCLTRNGSGQLHQLERQLSAVGSDEYHDLLCRSILDAEAVLVLNPTLAESYRAIGASVEVVTWGMDQARFPWPLPEEQTPAEINPDKTSILFAGLTEEPIKGYAVLLSACRHLWQERQDFELIVTSDAPQQSDPFVHYIGWKSQEELPVWFRHADICAVPTIAPDGLSRTSVEAMASGVSVIASQIGGLPYTVEEGVNGWLCRPGDVADWINQLRNVMDQPDQRKKYGQAGRKIFEERFTWKTVIENSYRPLFNKVKLKQRVINAP
ncbi:glycosyltransferase family 4 protein [uncultured Gimesia sp.]|uniref:glycosyltransferase family 4 protein n=1 Tax=uncultured Gimesia sp. TaxID=1678688 RepID=UPI002625679E|nr:glycosyltransferase family 4 protein [uncultured Gimesia sp.]